MRASKTRKIAVCGVMGALCLTVLLLGGVIPCATFCAPALSGVLILLVSAHCGVKYALLLYLAVALLAFLLVPDIEMSCIFAALLGYYPLLRGLFERVGPPWLRWPLKLAFFNAVVLALYSLLGLLWPMLTADIAAGGAWFTALLLVLGNITFILYDLSLLSLQRLFRARLRKFAGDRSGRRPAR